MRIDIKIVWLMSEKDSQNLSKNDQMTKYVCVNLFSNILIPFRLLYRICGSGYLIMSFMHCEIINSDSILVQNK